VTGRPVVLHVVAPGEIGGLERVVTLLGGAQQRAGADVHIAAVLTDHGFDHPFLPAARAAEVAGVHPVLVPPRGYFRERRALAALARRVRPDVIHTHGYRPDVIAAAGPLPPGEALVSTVHGFTGGDWKNRCYEWLQLHAYRRFDAVVGVAEPVAERLRQAGVAPRSVFVVPNAWRETVTPLHRAAARQALGLPADRLVLGWVGRLSVEKGPDVLLDALARLRDLPLTAAVLGSGSAREALEQRTRELGLDGQVRWYGMVPEAMRLFAAFDVFVLSSRTEGTPIVLFEAMAAGTPIVATRVGGVPRVVSPAEAALVAADDAEALAAAVRGVFAAPGLAADRARAARRRLEREFAVGPWVDRYRDVYEQARGGRGLRAG